MTGLTGEALGEKRLYQMESWYGHLLQGILEQHDQQIEQVEVNGIALVDGEKILVKL